MVVVWCGSGLTQLGIIDGVDVGRNRAYCVWCVCAQIIFRDLGVAKVCDLDLEGTFGKSL